MATWKKIVTESTTDTISQDTTGNANTATTLQNAQDFSVAGEVVMDPNVNGGNPVSFNGSSAVVLNTVVANNVLDVANFTGNAVVTGTEVANNSSAFLNTGNGGNSTLATTASVVEYINDQGFGAGSGDIGEVTLVAGNGLNITAVGGDTSESPEDTATAASGTFNTTIGLDLANNGGLEISVGGELQANVHADTIQINGSNEIAAVTSAVQNSSNNLATGDQIHDFVTTQGYITSSTFTVNPSGGIEVSVDNGTLGTGNVDIATGETLNISIDDLPNTSLTGNGTTHLGTTQLELGDASGANPTLTGMSALTGVANTGMSVTNLNDLDFAGDNPYSIFSTVTSNTITMGGSGSTIKIAGNLIVSGNTTTIDTSTVQVEDKLITLARSSANGSSGTDAFASGGGIELDTTNGAVGSIGNAAFTWTQLQGAGSVANGTGTATGLTGWKVRNSLDSNHADHCVAIMDFQSTDANPGAGANSAGVGSFMFDTAGDDLYIRVS